MVLLAHVIFPKKSGDDRSGPWAMSVLGRSEFTLAEMSACFLLLPQQLQRFACLCVGLLGGVCVVVAA